MQELLVAVFVIHEEEDFNITEHRELYRFLQKTLFTLAKGNLQKLDE
jgi:hypothetical protein